MYETQKCPEAFEFRYSQVLHFWQFIYGSTAAVDLCHFFSFLILYTVSSTPWKGDQPVARPLSTHTATQTQNKRTQTSIPRVGFEPTIPVFERAKTVHVFDRAAIVISTSGSLP
jgi:hypothetical protein